MQCQNRPTGRRLARQFYCPAHRFIVGPIASIDQRPKRRMTAQALMLERSCRNGPPFELLTAMDSRVRHAVAFIGEHLQSRILVDALAADAGLSVSQFTRLFRRDLGTTPSLFVNRLRL